MNNLPCLVLLVSSGDGGWVPFGAWPQAADRAEVEHARVSALVPAAMRHRMRYELVHSAVEAVHGPVLAGVAS